MLAGAFWAAYILLSARVGQAFEGGTGLALAMLVASALLVAPGVADAGEELLDPSLLALGAAVAMLSSAIPYSLELEALRRLPKRVFGVLMSLEPAVAATAGFVVLGEVLDARELVAIAPGRGRQRGGHENGRDGAPGRVASGAVAVTESPEAARGPPLPRVRRGQRHLAARASGSRPSAPPPDEFRERFKAQGQVVGVAHDRPGHAPATRRGTRSAAPPGAFNPYINIPNRLVVVQFHDFEGELKTLVWEPTVPEGSAEAPFYAQLIDRYGEWLSENVLATEYNTVAGALRPVRPARRRTWTTCPSTTCTCRTCGS